VRQAGAVPDPRGRERDVGRSRGQAAGKDKRHQHYLLKSTMTFQIPVNLVSACGLNFLGTQKIFGLMNTCLESAQLVIGHEDSIGLSVFKVHISATRWRIYT
jgi:hypothetical protein